MKPLFHYCSSSTFASIISHKSIWLSSLSLSNDTMEGRLVTQTFERLLAQSEYDADQKEKVRTAIKFAEDIFDGLGFCLSEKPDLLSQWRGYADDGQGFSIGFSRKYLEELAQAQEKGGYSFHIGKVLYEPAEHEKALKPTYDEIKEIIESGLLNEPINRLSFLSQNNSKQIQQFGENRANADNALWLKATMTYQIVHMLKNNAFSEEIEWRLVSYHLREGEDSALFRASGNRLIPYREFQLKPLATQPIAEVYIGPKNITPIPVIKKFLALNGFNDVLVKPSAATYR